MSILNSVANWYFKRRWDQLLEDFERADTIQEFTLQTLLHKASGTLYGKEYQFNSIKDYAEFAQNVPLQSYENISPYIERMMLGEDNICWPTPITWFAKSSGTTNNKSKFIPVSIETLETCHFQGGRDALSAYIHQVPESKLFSGKGVLIGGSHSINPLHQNTYYGDLSAVMMKHLPIWVHLFKTPDSSIALMEDWEKKVVEMAKHTLKENVTNISGVPTWTLVLFEKLLELSGKSNIHDIWPNMELYVHGGVHFAPYREQFSRYLPQQPMHYLETYNASEGFFGLQTSFETNALSLMINYGTFYEFIPLNKGEQAQPIPLWEVVVGENYAVVISNNSGLWRYQLGDTLMFSSVRPYQFSITGRTKLFINAFGEELMIDNADKAMAAACKNSGVSIRDYTAAPVYLDDPENAGHQWLIEFETEPEDPDAFMHALDITLKELNSDYESKRQKNVLLKPPKLVMLPRGTFHKWLEMKGKLGGQHKVPRLWNDRSIVEEVLLLVSPAFKE